MSKPRKRSSKKRRGLSPVDLKKLQKLQAKELGQARVMQVWWKLKCKKIAEQLIASLPKEGKSVAKRFLGGVEGLSMTNIEKLASLAKDSKHEANVVKLCEVFALRHPDENIRKIFIMGLGLIGGSKSRSVLEKAKSHSDLEIRSSASWVLEHMFKVTRKREK